MPQDDELVRSRQPPCDDPHRCGQTAGVLPNEPPDERPLPLPSRGGVVHRSSGPLLQIPWAQSALKRARRARTHAQIVMNTTSRTSSLRCLIPERQSSSLKSATRKAAQGLVAGRRQVQPWRTGARRANRRPPSLKGRPHQHRHTPWSRRARPRQPEPTAKTEPASGWVDSLRSSAALHPAAMPDRGAMCGHRRWIMQVDPGPGGCTSASIASRRPSTRRGSAHPAAALRPRAAHVGTSLADRRPPRHSLFRPLHQPSPAEPGCPSLIHYNLVA